MDTLPSQLPHTGIGEDNAFALFRDSMAKHSKGLGTDVFFAHMDPPTPKIASDLVGLNAQYNQNLLHPDLSPFASHVEKTVIDWLCTPFGMTCGHMCSGSTLANLSALWAAREAGANTVIASEDAHLSIPKAAHILGMGYIAIPVSSCGKMDRTLWPDLSKAAVVLTAGTTGRGAIDELDSTNALWTHVDAAWAGPLIFTQYASRLSGIKTADSIAISAHKWFYQPKSSAMILFKNPAAQEAISYGGSYLTTPNIGIEGSRGAAAIPLMATLLAWGHEGLATRIEKDMGNAEALAHRLDDDERATLKQMPTSGVVNWKPIKTKTTDALAALKHVSSQTKINGELWVRQVSANPNVVIDTVWNTISKTL